MSASVKTCFIAARGKNGVIGVDGQLPWSLRDDLAFFKKTTLGKPVLMGRRTWESLPRRPLPDRENIVLSRDWRYAPDGARVYSNLTTALSVARAIAARTGKDEVFVIGGASVYEAGLDMADRLYLTDVDANPEGDVVFPTIDPADWVEKWARPFSASARNDHNMVIRRLDRVEGH